MKLFLFSVLFLVFALAQVDYYAVLELARDCSYNEIVKSHKRLSERYHPSTNPGDREAAKKYQQVQRAHEVLTDWNKRNVYNQQGEAMVKMIERRQRTGRKDNEQRTRDSLIEWQISLEQLYSGTDIKFTLNKNVVCPACSGKGGKIATCPKCKGQGVMLKYMQMGPMTVQMQTHCDKCGGQGSWIEKKCEKCKAKKVVPENKQMVANIEKGMKDGEEIIFPKEAEQYPGYVPGDLVFIVKQQVHPTFERIGNNLYTEIHVSLEEALLGFSKQIKHLDGRKVTIERTEVTQPFQTMVLSGEGMPIRGENSYGDMHVTIKVNIPQMTPEEGKKLAEILGNNIA